MSFRRSEKIEVGKSYHILTQNTQLALTNSVIPMDYLEIYFEKLPDFHSSIPQLDRGTGLALCRYAKHSDPTAMTDRLFETISN